MQAIADVRRATPAQDNVPALDNVCFAASATDQDSPVDLNGPFAARAAAGHGRQRKGG